MRRSTIDQALVQMRCLHDTDAGRLRGVSLRFRCRLLRHNLAATPQPWRDRVQASIDDRETGLVTGDTPEYLVFSDGVLVVVLTVAAHVIQPDYPLTPLQTRHQKEATQALSDLNRYALADLADRAATHNINGRAGRRPDDEPAEPLPGWLRVAPTSDPTLSTWVEIHPDLETSRTAVARACGTTPDQTLIIEACGYGAYGRDRHRHRLDVLCAMHQIAATHHVELQAIGDWLDVEGATTRNDLDPQTVIEQFTAAYLAPYPSQTDYTRARMRALGWTQALHAAGVPDQYLDTSAITRDWFNDQVRSITATTGTNRHIEIFTRHHNA
ncbi:MAG: hypothetical protein QG597_5243 [Actinomycetota bacterium]|nr:hypothetical protein [Actinomycetota bacterium]